MSKKTIAVIMLIMILCMSHSGGGIVSPTYGQGNQDRTPLLAFSTLHYVYLPSFEGFAEQMNCISPLAAPPDNGTDSVLFSTVQVYDPSDGSVQCIAEGVDVLWSNTGRYLAVLKLHFFGYDRNWSGYITHFTIWDTVTQTAHAHDYQTGNALYWSPGDEYLVVTGYSGGSTYGRNAWVDIFPGDAAIDFTPPDRPGFTGMMGGFGGTFFMGFTVDNRVLLYTQPSYPEQPFFTVVDPATGEEQPADMDTTRYYPVDSPNTEEVSLSPQQGDLAAGRWYQDWGMDEDYVASGDNRFLAVLIENRNDGYLEDYSQSRATSAGDFARVLLVDMENGIYQEIDRSTFVWRMAWQP